MWFYRWGMDTQFFQRGGNISSDIESLDEEGFWYRLDIGNHVWIGRRAMVLSGMKKITIGDGAIVGAGSIVKKNVQSGSIAAGNPAKTI